MTTTEAAMPRPARRLHIPLLSEAVLIAVGVACFYLFPYDLGLMARIAAMAIFVLSLSLVLGQAGIATLGHAVFLGTGAYAAGLFALHVSADPILGLIAGGLVSGVLALVTGPLLLRTHGLTFLMLTIALAQIVFEVANRASGITGGDNGLTGFDMAPVFGLFRFDLYSQTGFLYALGVLVLTWFCLRKIVESPFGASLRGIRSEPRRMAALGNDTRRQLTVAWVIGGAFAGIAGAVMAQTAEVVALNSLSFVTSGDALVMLIVGGSRRLSGAIVGTVVFMLIHHTAASINPYHWQFVIGGLLIFCVLVLPNGIVGIPEAIRRRIGR